MLVSAFDVEFISEDVARCQEDRWALYVLSGVGLFEPKFTLVTHGPFDARVAKEVLPAMFAP